MAQHASGLETSGGGPCAIGDDIPAGGGGIGQVRIEAEYLGQRGLSVQGPGVKGTL